MPRVRRCYGPHALYRLCRAYETLGRRGLAQGATRIRSTNPRLRTVGQPTEALPVLRLPSASLATTTIASSLLTTRFASLRPTASATRPVRSFVLADASFVLRSVGTPWVHESFRIVCALPDARRSWLAGRLRHTPPLSADSLPTSGARHTDSVEEQALLVAQPSLRSSPQSKLLGRSAGSRGATSLRCVIRVRFGGCRYAPTPFSLLIATTMRKPTTTRCVRGGLKPRGLVNARRTCGARSSPSCFDLKQTSRTSVSEVTGSRRELLLTSAN